MAEDLEKACSMTSARSGGRPSWDLLIWNRTEQKPRWVRKPSSDTRPSGPLASVPVIQSPRDPVAPLLKPFHGSLVHSDKIQSPHCSLGSPRRLASVTSLSSLSPTQLLAHSAPAIHQALFHSLDL